jgi:hypothetical protein
LCGCCPSPCPGTPAHPGSPGFLHSFQFFLPGQWTSNYYVYTPQGFRALVGDEEPLPSRFRFLPLSVSRIPHWHPLAEFLVHTFVAANHQGIPLEDFHQENTFLLQIGKECRYPDATFYLVRLEDGRRIRFFVEIDNASKPVRSLLPASWTHKITFYEAYHDHCRRTGQDDSFRVLTLSNGGPAREQHLERHAATLMVRKQRSIFYGMPLADYLGNDRPLTYPLFLDNIGRIIPLVPSAQLTLHSSAQGLLPALAGSQPSLVG